MLILTQGQRPSPGLSCYLDQPDGRIQSSYREHHGKEQVSALTSEGGRAFPAMFTEHRETAFWLWPDPSGSQCFDSQHFSACMTLF